MKDLVLRARENNWILKPENLEEEYYYVTLHRPYNTDEKARLEYVLSNLNTLNKKVVFAIHPRTRNFMKTYGLNEPDYSKIHFINPQSYFSSLGFLFHSEGLITDSGGMQKEAYWLQKNVLPYEKRQNGPRLCPEAQIHCCLKI